MNPCNAEYLVFEKDEEVWRFAGEKWKELSFHAADEKGFFAVALSGGKTPVGFYRHLSTLNSVPWNSTHIFLADERFVPPVSPDSNYGMLREVLLRKVAVPAGNVHPVATEAPSPDISAERYEEDLRTFFKLPGDGIPEFDLIMLGIGEDGHTASLFPCTEVLSEKRRLAVPVKLGTTLHDRITLTLPVINNARNIFFLVSGRRKRTVMRKLRQGHDRTLPAAMVSSRKGRLIFLMDREAAGGSYQETI